MTEYDLTISGDGVQFLTAEGPPENLVVFLWKEHSRPVVFNGIDTNTPQGITRVGYIGWGTSQTELNVPADFQAGHMHWLDFNNGAINVTGEPFAQMHFILWHLQIGWSFDIQVFTA